MNITEKIDKYLNEGKLPKQHMDKLIRWKEKNLIDSNVSFIWFYKNKWYMFDIEDGAVDREESADKFIDLGIGKENNWTSTRNKELEKLLNVEKVYVADV